MNTQASAKQRTSALLSYLSLFTSLSTLLCCALPSLLVLVGLGASVGTMLSTLPWLVTLSKHKRWTFGVSGALIVLSFLNMYLIAPKLRAQACDPSTPACDQASRMSKIILWGSAGIYSVGFFVAYALGPILRQLDS
jgi:mercuric ion transport protein